MAIFDLPKKKVLKNGQLQQETEPGNLTLQQAEKPLDGLPGATSPLTAFQMGASKDAAKMAGSKANVERIQSDANKDASIVTEKTAASQASTGQAYNAEMNNLAKNIGVMGSFESRVPSLMLKNFNEKVLPGAQAVKELTIDPNSELAKADPQARDALLRGRKVWLVTKSNPDGTQQQELQYGPDGSSTNVVRNTVGPALVGGAAPDTEVAGTTAAVNLVQQGVGESQIINSFNKDEGVSAHIAQALPDEAKIGWAMDLVTPEERAQLEQLGNIRDMNQTQLQDLIRREQDKFDEIGKAQAILADSIASVEQKSEARRYLVAQGMEGKLAPSEKLNNIAKQIEDNDTVSILGKSMTVDEMLKDQFIQNLALDGLQDPAFMEQLKKDPNTAAFAEYLGRNEQAWNNMLAPIKAQVDGVKGVREAMTKNASWGDGTVIPAELMDKMLPGWNDLRRTGTIRKPALLEAMQGIKNPAEQKAVTALAQGSQVDPQRWKELQGMNITTLKNKGLLDGKKTFGTLVQAEQQRQEAANKVRGKSPQEATKALVGPVLQDWLPQIDEINKTLKTSGIDITTVDRSKLDPKMRASIDIIKELHSYIQPDGTLNPKFANELTNTSQDFWDGATVESTLDVDHITDLLNRAVAEAGNIDGFTKAAQAVKLAANPITAYEPGSVEEKAAVSKTFGKMMGKLAVPPSIEVADLEKWLGSEPTTGYYKEGKMSNLGHMMYDPTVQGMLTKLGINKADLLDKPDRVLPTLLNTEIGQQTVADYMKRKATLVPDMDKLKALIARDPEANSFWRNVIRSPRYVDRAEVAKQLDKVLKLADIGTMRGWQSSIGKTMEDAANTLHSPEVKTTQVGQVGFGSREASDDFPGLLQDIINQLKPDLAS